MPNAKESEFQAAVIQLAELNGWLVYHAANTKGQLRGQTAAGFPDLVLVKGKKIMFRELKIGRNTATTQQLFWQAHLKSGGHDVAIWHPDYWDAIEATLMAGRPERLRPLEGS